MILVIGSEGDLSYLYSYVFALKRGSCDPYPAALVPELFLLQIRFV